MTGTITETKVWKDLNGKPTAFLFRITQTGGKCNVGHIEGPDNSKCKVGASVKASGWASYGAFGNTPDDFAPMLHATKMTCK
ncbi:MAG: hypothetical protein JNM89_16080 [Hyphomicrobiaceae bacterium]|nr:hypothetical protein [Hyphomicrobiaceae bacterium]